MSNFIDDRKTTTIKQAWYVVAQSKEITSSKPFGTTLCGVPLVLFRDVDQTIQVLHAMCPHRGADLSKGAISNGCVVCPYHGWKFDGDGQCTHVPTQPDCKSKASVPTYLVMEQDGFVWVCLTEPNSSPPRLDLLNTSNMSTTWVRREVPLPMMWWVENMLDVTHVPFAHASTFGGEALPLPHIDVVYHDQPLSGFTASLQMTQTYNWLTRLLYKQQGAEMKMDVTIHHWMPGSTCFEVKLDGGKRTQLLWSLVTPVDEHHCITWLGIGRDYWHVPGFGWLTDSIGRWFANRVLDEDQELGQKAMIAPTTLHMTQPQSVPADAPCLAFLKLANKLLVQEDSVET